MNTIEMVGIRAFQMSIHIFNLFLCRISWSICLGILTAEFAILVLICLGSAFELISSFAANVTNTIIGIRSPCSNQISISLRLESLIINIFSRHLGHLRTISFMKMGARVLAKFTFAFFIRNMECFNAAQIFVVEIKQCIT